MRNLIAIVVGTLVAIAVGAGFERLGAVFYPIWNDHVATDRDLLVAMLHMPFPAKLIVAAGWLVAPFVGTWLCLRIGASSAAGWVVAGLFLVAGIAGQVSVPHPLWMQACAVILPLIGGLLAQRLHHTPYPGEALLG